MLLGATIERNNCSDLIIIFSFIFIILTRKKNKKREMKTFIIYCLGQDFRNEQFMRLNVQQCQHEMQRVTHFFR